METYAERLDHAVGRQIRAELDERGMDQKTLAEKMGIERATLNRYLMNHRSMNMTMFLRLTEALEISPADLLGKAQNRLNSTPEGE